MTEAIVSTRTLGKTIRNKTILRDITVEASPGSVVGIIGKNGAGKTTLLEILLGFAAPTTGTSQLFGHDSFTLPAAIKGRIGFAPQEEELVHLITGRQQLALTAALYGRWNHALVERLGNAWEVPLDQVIQTLSGGERQKLSTLSALGHEPELLVLDEPVSSLDPISRRRFLQEMIDITAERTRTVLFSSHIVSDLERIADQIWLLRAGVIAWAGPLDALKESVVRLRINARKPLPPAVPLLHVISQQITGQRASAVVSHWDESQLEQLRTVLDADIDAESLSLEDIFIEFHT